MRKSQTTLLISFAVLIACVAIGYTLVGQLNLSCGNGIVNAGEQCDDANSVETDGCTRQCVREIPDEVEDLLPYESYFLDAWREQLTHPRGSLSTQTGMRYNPLTRAWALHPLASGTGDIAHGAYNITYVMEGAVNAAESTHNPEILEGLSQFYLDYLHLRFTTLGQMRNEVRAKPLTLTGVLMDMNADGTLKASADPDSYRTLTWYEPISHPRIKFRVRECRLCMMQFYISPARLIRVIATMPANTRTPLMTQFVSEYTPIMINDHLLRYDAWLKTQWARPPSQRQMSDTDMMQMSAMADVLGANLHDPILVPLTSQVRERLLSLLTTGVNGLKLRANYHPETKDWAGNTVGSMDLFEGDFDNYIDYKYAGYSGPIPPFPSDAELPKPVGVGYDVGHAWRFPQVLRSLYDNKDLLNLPFPTADDMRLLANQYAYKVFKGDFNMPQLNNFMDGRDTWYRVGYGANYIGIGPTQYCYTFDREFKNGTYPEDRAQKYPCVGGFNGRIAWGRLVEFQPDLKKVVLATLDLLNAKEPDRVTFRERYMSYGNNEPFQIWEEGLRTTPDNNPWFMLLPFILLSDLSNPVAVPTATQTLRPAASNLPAQVTLPDDTHVNTACRTQAFREDIAVCLNALIDAHQGKETLSLQIASGTYLMKTQTITLFNKKNIQISGTSIAGENAILRMDPSAARNRNDLYFMVQAFNGSNIALKNLTLDGNGLSGQRGIGACPLPFRTLRNMTVRNVSFRNMSLYGMIAGNTYSEGLVNVPAQGGAYPALTQLYTYLRLLPATQRYCSGNISGITFENNKVDIGIASVALKSMGFVLAPYTSKQPFADRTTSTSNWSEVARSLARRNIAITVKNNAFRGFGPEADSGIRIQSAANISIIGNTFTDAGFTQGFRSGGQVNIGQNVWNANIASNRFYLSPKTVDPARGIVVANGFDQHSLYGFGKNLGLSSPSFNITIKDNALSNSLIRLADCCLATNANISAYCTNAEALGQLANENLVITGNTNITAGNSAGSLIWQNSKKDIGKPWTAICRPSLNMTVSE